MAQYIDKDAVVAEIESMVEKAKAERVLYPNTLLSAKDLLLLEDLEKILSFLDTLEVKEVDEQKERMNECPYRQVGCTMYEGKILECNGACSWVVDYPRLKELKVQKGE